jgi:hypothetical protein
MCVEVQSSSTQNKFHRYDERLYSFYATVRLTQTRKGIQKIQTEKDLLDLSNETVGNRERPNEPRRKKRRDNKYPKLKKHRKEYKKQNGNVT